MDRFQCYHCMLITSRPNGQNSDIHWNRQRLKYWPMLKIAIQGRFARCHANKEFLFFPWPQTVDSKISKNIKYCIKLIFKTMLSDSWDKILISLFTFGVGAIFQLFLAHQINCTSTVTQIKTFIKSSSFCEHFFCPANSPNWQ